MAGEKEIARFPLVARIDRQSFMLVQPGPAGTPMFSMTPVEMFGAMASTDVVSALGFTPLSSSVTWSAGGVDTLDPDLLIDGTTLRISATLTHDYTFTGGLAASALPTSESGLPAGRFWNNGGVVCVATP